jgi:hypothetical protein
MSDARGYNPMRWNCERSGCFNIKCRPKIEMFHDCFPRNINFSDVDGIVELNGRGLMLEWKNKPTTILGTGQGYMFERLTTGRVLTVVCAAGNAETMEMTHIAAFVDGCWRPWREASLQVLRERIKTWVRWAQTKKMPKTTRTSTQAATSATTASPAAPTRRSASA